MKRNIVFQLRSYQTTSTDTTMSKQSRDICQNTIVSQAVTKLRRCVGFVTVLTSLGRSRYRRGPSLPRQLFSFTCYTQGMTDSFFIRLYRMNKRTFSRLANLITLQQVVSGRALTKAFPLLRLSVTLRWLASGLYLDIPLAHCISISSMYHYVDVTLRDMDRSLKLTFPYKNEQWLQETSKGFSRQGRSTLYRFYAALDGLAIKIAEPPRQEVGNTSTYYNRKGFFAINLQAACDDKYGFVFASGLAAGSTHDSTASAMSSLATLLNDRDNDLPLGYWVACDDAYTAVSNMITACPGRNLPRDKDCFNYWLSSARIHIEQAFGILVARWGVLWRPFRVKVRKMAMVIVLLCKLHNFIIDEMNSCEVPPPSGIDTTDDTCQPDYSFIPQDLCDTDDLRHRRRLDLESSDLRDTFTSEIKDTALRSHSLY